MMVRVLVLDVTAVALNPDEQQLMAVREPPCAWLPWILINRDMQARFFCG
jgi:hypothetical protein